MDQGVKILLFKMPAGRDTYANKLLEILSAPIGNIVMLTTYRRRWIPEEIFNNPRQLEGNKAWFICVDAEKHEVDNKKHFDVKRFIPIREVEITRIEKIKDDINIFVKTGGYIKFNPEELDSLKTELEKKFSKENLPPNERSYIQTGIDLNFKGMSVAADENEIRDAWMNIVDVLSETSQYADIPFYRIVGLKDSEGKDVRLKQAPDGKQAMYELVRNREYRLIVECRFPAKAYDRAPVTLDIHHDSSLHISSDLTFSSRIEQKECTIVPEKVGGFSMKIEYNTSRVWQSTLIKFKVTEGTLTYKIRRNAVCLTFLAIIVVLCLLLGYLMEDIIGILISLLLSAIIPPFITRLLTSS